MLRVKMVKTIRWTQLLAGVILLTLLALAVTLATSWLTPHQPPIVVSKDSARPVSLDRSIKRYHRTPEPVSGDLNVAGSGSGNTLMILWAEAFQKHYPEVHVLIESKGSYTATQALVAGTAQLGILSRRMNAQEHEQFELKFGYKPMRVLAAVDALAVFVNKTNPLEQLTLQEVDGIFSTTRKGGGKNIKSWGDLGLTDEWANKPIHLYSTLSLGGTYSVFREKALFRGEYKETVQELPGLASVIQGIIADRYAIGFSGISYRTAEVKPLKLARNPGELYYEASVEELREGTYPLTRYFNLYCNKPPDQPLEPLVREFLRFVLSREGQEIVSKAGYTPISGTLDLEQLASIN